MLEATGEPPLDRIATRMSVGAGPSGSVHTTTKPPFGNAATSGSISRPEPAPPGKKNRLGAGTGVLAGLKKLNAMSLSVTVPLVREFSTVTATTLPSDSVARCEDSAVVVLFATAILN